MIRNTISHEIILKNINNISHNQNTSMWGILHNCTRSKKKSLAESLYITIRQQNDTIRQQNRTKKQFPFNLEKMLSDKYIS